ncbi:MAG TPA: TonB-dependent receptor, partial [Gammaproteobacteria bacterium]|nr:TonB-dependent receptor [Gammaproteobacteria bacterium]
MPSFRAMSRGHWVLLCSAFLLFLSPIVVFAQDAATADADPETRENRSADEDPLELGEVTVTAQKRESSLRDVPFSVGVMTQEALHRAGASNMEDVAKNIAGFAVQDLGPGQSQVVIRGVSAGQIVRDQPGVKPSVGVYLDESVISLSLFTPDLELVDLKRVEVLRGPQGTLFGAGSLSGTVRYITNEPVLGYTYVETAVEGSAVLGDEFGEGSVDYGGMLSGIVNVPISDSAAFRGVVYYRHLAGYIDAYQPGGSINENVNDGYRQGGRLTFRFEPTNALTITPRVVYQYTEVNGFNRIDIYNILANPYTTTRPQVTLGGRSQYTQLEEKFTDDFLLGDVVIEGELTNDLLLTSVTSYTDREVLQIRDATQLTGSITGGTIGLPENVYTLDAPLFDKTLVEVFTQEVRLSNALDTNADFRWVSGIFYSKMDRKYSQDLIVDGFTAISGVPSDDILAPEDTLYYSRIPYELSQYAIFGEGTWAFTNALDFTLGLRYYSYEEERLLFFDGIFAATVLGEPGQTEADGFSPRVMMDYEVNDSVTLNA